MNTSEHRYLALWEFHVKPESVSAFERIYGPNGDWAQLFRQSPDYLGTELIRDLDRPGRYLTLDRCLAKPSTNSSNPTTTPTPRWTSNARA